MVRITIGTIDLIIVGIAQARNQKACLFCGDAGVSHVLLCLGVCLQCICICVNLILEISILFGRFFF
jgi:hypothetical protein